MGTANLLDCCRHSKSVKAVVVVTTDKCYENNESLGDIGKMINWEVKIRIALLKLHQNW